MIIRLFFGRYTIRRQLFQGRYTLEKLLSIKCLMISMDFKTQKNLCREETRQPFFFQKKKEKTSIKSWTLI